MSTKVFWNLLMFGTISLVLNLRGMAYNNNVIDKHLAYFGLFLQLSNSDGAECLPIWSKTNSNEHFLQKFTLLSKFNRGIQVWAWRHFVWSRLCPNGWTALFHGLVVCPVEHSGILDAYTNIYSFIDES